MCLPEYLTPLSPLPDLSRAMYFCSGAAQLLILASSTENILPRGFMVVVMVVVVVVVVKMVAAMTAAATAVIMLTLYRPHLYAHIRMGEYELSRLRVERESVDTIACG